MAPFGRDRFALLEACVGGARGLSRSCGIASFFFEHFSTYIHPLCTCVLVHGVGSSICVFNSLDAGSMTTAMDVTEHVFCLLLG